MHYNKAEERLVRYCMEDWQRRGMNVLQVGLHAPILPEFFWDCGFDVTCCEENFRAAQQAAERTGPRISYQIGKADSLPFDDDSFEYAFLALHAGSFYVQEYGVPSFLKENGQKNGQAYLSELCRVARLGVVIVGKNAFSPCRAAYVGKEYNPFSLWTSCRRLCPQGRVRFASTGFIPRFLHKKLPLLNNAVSLVPFGALIGFGLEFNALPVTGIGAFIKSEQRKMEQVSCIQRNS